MMTSKRPLEAAATRAWIIAAITVVFLLGPPLTASAKSPRDKARALFLQGNALFAREDYRGALKFYKAAWEHYPSYKIDFNIGTTLEVLGWLTKAAEHYEYFLLRVNRAKEKPIISMTHSRLAALRKRLSSLLIRCNISGAEVTADTWRLGRTPLPHRRYFTPGTYTLKVNKPGYSPYSKTFMLLAGDFQRLDIALKPEPPVAAPAAAAAPAGLAAGADVPARGSPQKPLSAGPTTALKAPANTGPWQAREPATVSPPRPGTEPFYKKWWFWTVVGAVVVGAAVGGGVAATQTGGSDTLPMGELGEIR